MRLSYSGYSTIHSCEKMFFLTYILRKVPREKPDYFILGDAYHYAWKVYRHPNGRELDHAQKMVVVKDRLWNYCPDDVAKEAWRLFEANVIEPWDPVLTKIHTVDQLIEIPFKGHSVVIKGDAIAEATYQGKPILVHVEDKTAKSVAGNYRAQKRVDPQIVHYTWGLSLGLRKRIEYVYFNAVSKTKTPETWRELIHIEDDSLRRWEFSLTKTLERIESNMEKGFPDGWPENLDNCFTYRRCDYWPICQYHPFQVPGPSWPGWTGFKDKEDIR